MLTARKSAVVECNELLVAGSSIKKLNKIRNSGETKTKRVGK